MNVLLILEGNEEQTLYEIAENSGFSSCFNVRAVNAEGFGNIGPYFQSEISNEYNDCIICIYDVDDRIDDENSPYNLVRKDLYEILYDYEKVDAISTCTNPNILQFFLLGADKLDKVKIVASSKKENTLILNKYWDKLGKKKAYDASEWQLEIIKNSFIYGPHSYDDLLKNAEELKLDYKNNNPGSNLLPLLKALVNGDKSYFEKAIEIKKLEE